METINLPISQQNTEAFKKELEWFSKVLDIRIQLYFEQESSYEDILQIPAPILDGDPSNYARLVRQYDMSNEERLLIMLAFVPYLNPSILDVFFIKNTNLDKPFTEFGGVQLPFRKGFFPTGETALFLLAGKNLNRRIDYIPLLHSTCFLFSDGILHLSSPQDAKEGEIYHVLSVTPEYIHFLTTGSAYSPEYGAKFPAKELTTGLEWKDLVLDDYTMEMIDEIQVWITQQSVLMEKWGLQSQLKPGFRVLFYGPPGTGKTLTASLLGKVTDLKVYRVDLSLVVSKYIGETEKNLANIFDQAAHKKWILFFDEADALFGKRTQTNDAKDRYANQEIAYLLQKIEDFPGVVILATNLKKNMDKAFARRFQSIIYFSMPDEKARYQLWTKAFAPLHFMKNTIDFYQIAKKYELSGGSINNILRYCSLRAVQRTPTKITEEDIIMGIRREYAKEGKMTI